MKPKQILKVRKITIFFSYLLILFFAYIALKSIFHSTDPIIRFFSSITNLFLNLVDKFASLILHWTGSPRTIQNHNIILDGFRIEGFTTVLMYKKVTIFYISLLWLTRSSTWRRIGFTGIYLVLGFLFAVIYNVAGAYYINVDNYIYVLLSTIYGLVFLSMNTILLVWYLMNRKSWSLSPSKPSAIINWIERKLPDIIILLYVYSVILFSLGFVNFRLWIRFLFGTSQKILGLLGYEAVLESNLLIGDNGSISLSLGCLGLMTMFLFAALIYLTGNKDRRTWWYIIFGVLLLNLANIARFVLLFIHLQKYGDYMFAMEVHDLYNIAIYSIVFILWVIWFERFTDIRKVIKSKGEKSDITQESSRL